ncbi:hypothetical protein [Paenibacillus harenae]|uniref:hypothetical protein n=1 Tax=Paenibacillus harenae TaxID=306543 RepID=UPI00048DF1E9
MGPAFLSECLLACAALADASDGRAVMQIALKHDMLIATTDWRFATASVRPRGIRSSRWASSWTLLRVLSDMPGSPRSALDTVCTVNPSLEAIC